MKCPKCDREDFFCIYRSSKTLIEFRVLDTKGKVPTGLKPYKGNWKEITNDQKTVIYECLFGDKSPMLHIPKGDKLLFLRCYSCENIIIPSEINGVGHIELMPGNDGVLFLSKDWVEDLKSAATGTNNLLKLLGIIDGIPPEGIEMEKIIDFISKKKNKEDGLQTDWYENGLKKSEKTLMDGKPNGLWTEWYENGQKKFEGAYKNGKPNGLVTWWKDYGQKERERNYKDGKEDGKQSQLYENGQKRFEETYKNGERISKKEWNEDGSVKE